MNSLFKMAISLLTLALFIILHYLPISDILYILLIYFVLPTGMHTSLEQGFSLSVPFVDLYLMPRTVAGM